MLGSKTALYGRTDYPITELGDEPGKTAPSRTVKIIGYDQNKYCKVEVKGVVVEIKRGYLYKKGRSFYSNNKQNFSHRELCDLTNYR